MTFRPIDGYKISYEYHDTRNVYNEVFKRTNFPYLCLENLIFYATYTMKIRACAKFPERCFDTNS